MENILNRKLPYWMRLDSSKYSPYIIILVLLFPIAVIYSQLVFAPCDDAYIFLVYARNFVEGHGLTYNGAVVEGFSSVLWVVALSILGLTKIPLPGLAEGLSILTGLLTLLMTYKLAKIANIDLRWVLVPLILLVATGDFVFYMSVGLEQVLFAGLIALSVALSYSPNPKDVLRSYYYPFLLAIMILTRPEGALISALLLSILAIKSRSWLSAFRCGIWLTLMLAPALVAKRLYYGYWLPNTYYVKSDAGLANLGQGVLYFVRSYLRYGGIAIIASVLAVFGFYKEKWRFFGDVWPLLLISMVWLVYVVIQGGDNLVGGRLVLPILPLVYVALIKLLTEINLKPKLLAIITVGAVSSLVLGYLFDPYVANHANKWRVYFERRQKAGTYLQENYPSGTLVALNSAGIIPYYSKLPTIDMLGLNDVHIAHKGKRDLDLNYAHQAGDGVYVLSREPDIILLGAIASQKPAFFISDQEIWNSPQFEDNYELATWPTVGYAYVRKE